MHRTQRLIGLSGLALISACALGACGSSDGEPAADGATAAPERGAQEPDGQTPDARTDAASSADRSVAVDAAAPDRGLPADLGASFTDGGCLSFAAASQICGFNSDGTACTLAVSCKLSSDVGQCKINCEMGAVSSNCYDAKAAQCLTDAVAAASCAALEACKWIL